MIELPDLQQKLQQNPWDLWKSCDSCKLWNYLNRRKPLNLRQIDVFALAWHASGQRCKSSHSPLPLRGNSAEER